MLRRIAELHGAGTVILVRIEPELAANGQRRITPLASAFMCHTKGYLLTCAHSFSVADQLAMVRVPQNKEFMPLTRIGDEYLPVKLKQYDAINDVALLKIPASASVPPGMFGDESSVEIGALCANLGFPFADLGLHVRHVSSAHISAKVMSASGTRQFQLDGIALAGCSGGPLIDVGSGKIVGIVSGRFDPNAYKDGLPIGGSTFANNVSISYATSISYGLELLKSEGIND